MLASVKVRAFFILPAWMKGLRPWTVSRMARKRSRTRSSKSSGRRNNRRTSRKRRRETRQMTEQQETALTAAYEAQLAERDSRIAEFGAGEVGGCTIGSVSVLFFQIKCNVFEQWTSYGVR